MNFIFFFLLPEASIEAGSDWCVYDTGELWCVVSVQCALSLHVPKHVLETQYSELVKLLANISDLHYVFKYFLLLLWSGYHMSVHVDTVCYSLSRL